MDNLEWLHKRMRNQFSGPTPIERAAEGLSGFPRRPATAIPPRGRTALDLVEQAAELVRSIEDNATDIETRARSLAEDAIKRLQASEKQIQALEEKHAAAEAHINDVNARLQEAGEAFEKERARVQAAEDLLPRLEMRARAAEARAEECENALSRIEFAIRTKILKEGSSRKGAVAA
ncbi:MAG: hypothetical protein ACRECV_11850 [Xanthobacteraceae bacterium]